MTDQIKLLFRAERGIFLDANKKGSNNHDGVARLQCFAKLNNYRRIRVSIDSLLSRLIETIESPTILADGGVKKSLLD
jgi:hypothetical protein